MNNEIFTSNKIGRYLDRVHAYREHRVTNPITMELDPSGACQHKCPGCAGGMRDPLNMSRDNMFQVLQEFADNSVKGVTFTGGGEPLINRATPAAVVMAHGLEMDVGFITNGSLISPAIANVLAEHCTWVRISLDASNAKEFEESHGVDEGIWKDTLRGIKALTDAKWKATRACTVGVGYLTSEKTADGMQPATELAKDLGANYIQFRPYHGNIGCWDASGEIERLQLRFNGPGFRVLGSLQKYSLMRPGTVSEPRTYDYCHGAHFVGVVQADGWMPVCCHYRGKDNRYIGNIFETPLAEIWARTRTREIITGVDVHRCLSLCRADHINRSIQELMTPKQHESFL